MIYSRRVMNSVVILAVVAMVWMSWIFAGRLNPVLETNLLDDSSVTETADTPTQEDIIEKLRQESQ